MSSTSENESEILLGNKQLLGVFAVVALLLAIAFTGGYMLGKNSGEKKAAASTADTTADTVANPLTKTVAPDDASSTKADPPAPVEVAKPEPAVIPPAKVKAATQEDVLGAPKRTSPEGTPAPGQTFVQVAALTHIQASAMADVLRNKKFHARIAPKPGSASIFRVLVGPLKDAGDLSNTRDSLRKIGFRDVIVQRY